MKQSGGGAFARGWRTEVPSGLLGSTNFDILENEKTQKYYHFEFLLLNLSALMRA